MCELIYKIEIELITRSLNMIFIFNQYLVIYPTVIFKVLTFSSTEEREVHVEVYKVKHKVVYFSFFFYVAPHLLC